MCKPAILLANSIVAVTFVVCFAASASPAAAALGTGGGYDVYAGPGGERSATLLGFAAIGDRRASLALGALRFDDNLAGDGIGGLGVISLPLSANGLLRLWGTRFVGSESFRAWRIKAGPEISLGSDRTLGLYAVHDESNLAGVSNGATAEVGVPLAAGLTGRMIGGMTSARETPHAMQGALGLSWAPAPRFELTADAGLARNGAIAAIPGRAGGGRGPLGLPPLGGTADAPPSETSAARTEGLFAAGIRVFFP